MHHIRTLIIVMLGAALMAGCGGVAQRPYSEDLEATRVARTHLYSGEYPQAAEEYLRLAAAASGDAAIAYRIDAAWAFALAGQTQNARRILGELGSAALPADLHTREQLTRARLALVDGRPEEALAIAGAAPSADESPELAARYHGVRADVLEATGKPIESARERVQLELVLTDGTALNENRRRIWESLSLLSPEALEAAHIPPPSTLGGWIELAAVGKSSMGDPNTLGQAIALWRNRYPGHPAGEAIVPMLIDDSRIAWAPARRVALLLPFEGQFANAANAVRDGFMAAWFADTDTENRPSVLVRDSSGDNIRFIYNRAIEEGADFVVGPLRRSSVTNLARAGNLSVPTLTLNHADGTGSTAALPVSGLFQFALSPESEAQRVAEYAALAGHTHAAVLTPFGAWGDRVAVAFTDAWQGLGGEVVERQNYLNDGSDMSIAVKQLLNIDESDARHSSLQAVLGGELKKEVRRRQDVDFVFMAAFPRQGRQLRPQLEFHRAQDLPVYATSHIYSGIADAEADRDIDGVVFGDMPWVLEPTAVGASLRRDVGVMWADSMNSFIRLYAFGADAYYLVKELGKLRAQQYAQLQGVTGTLSLNKDNQIDRGLMWARFSRGTPRVLADEPTPTFQ